VSIFLLQVQTADKIVTEKLVDAGKLLDVRVLDYVIIGSKGGYFSFTESGLMNF
jgi:DNA repair protein RadC